MRGHDVLLDLQRATGSAAEICMKCRRTEKGASELVFLPLSPLAHYSRRARVPLPTPTDRPTEGRPMPPPPLLPRPRPSVALSVPPSLPPAAPLGRSPQLSVSPATRQIRTERTVAHRIQCTPLFRDPYILHSRSNVQQDFSRRVRFVRGEDEGKGRWSDRVRV